MIDQIGLLSARRAYEFRPDAIRLTVLTVPEVQKKILGSVNFQLSEIGSPMATFGPVPRTLPPGLVFNWGVIAFPAGALTPIRFLHFEQRRIVIDVAGHSTAIDLIFDRVRGTLADVRAPDGSPAIGEPIRTMDYSEITARFSVSPVAIIPPGLREFFDRTVMPGSMAQRQIVVPSLHMRVQPLSKEYPGWRTSDHTTFQFGLRAGTDPDSRVYFSAAPLDTDAHLSYLRELDAALAAQE